VVSWLAVLIGELLTHAGKKEREGRDEICTQGRAKFVMMRGYEREKFPLEAMNDDQTAKEKNKGSGHLKKKI
jgi:hypothetical protein